MISSCEKYTDEELIQKSLENIEYFGCLFERYEKKLLMYILRISSFSQNEAEEVLQESFIKTWKNLNSFDVNDSTLKFSTWVYRIVHNTTITEWKKTQSKGRENLHQVDDEIFQNIASHLNIEKDFAQIIDEKNIRIILDAMPKSYKEILVLRFLEELSYREISDILQKPTGTISTQVKRAKESFIQTAKKQKIEFEL